MNPEIVIGMLRTLIDAFLLTCRQKYPPVFQQSGAYKYGAAKDSKDDEVTSKYREVVVMDVCEYFNKSAALLLFQLAPPDRLKDFKDPIRDTAGWLRQCLGDWLTMRVMGKIGYYYSPVGLTLELVEELPDIDEMLREVEKRLFVDIDIPVYGGMYWHRGVDEGDESITFDKPWTMPIRQLQGMMSKDVRIAAELEFMQVSGLPNTLHETTIPLVNANGNRLGWITVPVKVEIRTPEQKDSEPVAQN